VIPRCTSTTHYTSLLQQQALGFGFKILLKLQVDNAGSQYEARDPRTGQEKLHLVDLTIEVVLPEVQIFIISKFITNTDVCNYYKHIHW
jgi:hypothetical protein